MATSLTYEGMLAEIVRQDSQKLDLVADTRRTSVIVAPLSEREGEPNRVVLDVDRVGHDLASFALNSHAEGQLSNDLGIPKRYFDRMLQDAPNLLQSNVDHWLANEPQRRLVRGFKPTLEGGIGTGRGWLSDRYRRLDNIEIARKIFPIFENVPGLTFHQAQLTDTKFYLRAVLPNVSVDLKPGQTWMYKGEPVVGDVVQAGIEIKNSEVGASSLVIQPFVLRLICINGMTVNEFGTNRRHVGKRITDGEEQFYADETIAADDEAFWLAVRDVAASTLTQVRFNEIATRLSDIIHSDKIVAPIAATEELQQRFSLSDEERERVLTNLVAEGDLSQWGALNAITATAKTVESFDRQAELEALGWTVAQMPGKEWAKVAVAA